MDLELTGRPTVVSRFTQNRGDARLCGARNGRAQREQDEQREANFSERIGFSIDQCLKLPVLIDTASGLVFIELHALFLVRMDRSNRSACCSLILPSSVASASAASSAFFSD